MTLTLTLTGVCAGGNHLTFNVTGDRMATVRSDLSDMSAPITDADLAAFVKVWCRMVKAGRTNAQARAVLQAGVTVAV